MIIRIFGRDEIQRAVATVYDFRHLHETNKLDVLTGYLLEPIEKGERILYQHKTGKWYEFIIDEPEIIHDEGTKYYFTAVDSLVEIDGDWIEDKRPSTLANAATEILAPTRWTVGTVTSKPAVPLTFYRISPREALDSLLEAYPVEIQTRITVGTSGVTARTLDVLDRVGSDLGKRFVYDKDLTTVKRTYSQGKIITALYGFGKGEEIGDGFGRRIDFASVNGGVPYVFDPAVLAVYGRVNGGSRAHVFDYINYEDVDDKAVLLALTQAEYLKRSVPQVSYEATVIDLGLEHENVSIGDTVKVIDGLHRFQTRVNYLLEDEENSNQVRLANYIKNITDSNNELIQKVGDLASHAGVWDESQKLADGSYLDGVLDALNEQANASGGWTTIQDGRGILTINAPTEAAATMAVNIVGGTIRVASFKNGDGTWKWRTFITGEIVAADMITAGILKGGKVNWNLETGVLYIGDSVGTASLFWDGANLSLNVNSLKIQSKDVATKADVTLTSDAWTATFGQIGATNLILNSDKYIPLYANLAEYPVATEPFDTYGRVRTMGPQILTTYTPIYFDAIEGEKYTTSVDVMTSAPAGSVTVYGGGSTLLPSGKWVRIYGTKTATTTGPMRMPGLYSETLGGWWLQYKNFKVETGSVATDWTLHQDEFYTGITKIDKDGAHFGKQGETVETGVAYDGLRIYDGVSEKAYFGETGSFVPELRVNTITGSNIINTVDSITLDIGSGKTYQSFTSAISGLNAGGDAKYLRQGAEIVFNLYGQIMDNLYILGFIGGTLRINFLPNAKLIGMIYANGCTSRINISNGILKHDGNNKNLIVAYACSYIHVDSMKFDASGATDITGLRLFDGSVGYANGCDFGKMQIGAMAYDGSILSAADNIGSCLSRGYYTSDGTINAKGKIPKGIVANLYNGGWYNASGATTPTDSLFQPPAYVPPASIDTTFSDIFIPTNISTFSVQYGATSTYYGANAVQNRWDASSGQFKGRMSFGADLYNFIGDRKAGTTPTLQMRVRRKNSTHGSNYGPDLPSPKPENFTTSPAFGKLARGQWSAWVTIPYTLITSGGYVFSFYNGSTGNDYAIFDAAEISVTKIKNV